MKSAVCNLNLKPIMLRVCSFFGDGVDAGGGGGGGGGGVVNLRKITFEYTRLEKYSFIRILIGK